MLIHVNNLLMDLVPPVHKRISSNNLEFRRLASVEVGLLNLL